MFGKFFLTDVQTLCRRSQQHMAQGATPGFSIDCGADREILLKLLNDTLAMELVCVLRCRRYQLVKSGIHSQGVADEFVAHAHVEQAHADQIAARIVELGGEPDFSLDGLVCRSQTAFMVGRSIIDLIKEDMVSECITMDNYRDIIKFLSVRDPVSCRMMEGILAAEIKHAEQLASQLEGTPA